MAGKYIDETRLCQAADMSRHVMQFFREERMRGVRHLAGFRYSLGAARKPTYINFISLYCDIVGRNLFAKNPRVSLSTFDKGQKAVVDAMEQWINEELDHMQFANTMQRIVLDALFAIGIVKVGLATPEEAANVGWNLAPGQPYLKRIDLDDFVFQHDVSEFSECDFMGHRFVADLEAVIDSPLYNKKARERLAASTNREYNREGDERIGMIGRPSQGWYEGFKDKVELWEFYLPKEKLVCTFSENDLSGPDSENGVAALRVQPWLGPDTGPYHILAYKTIPGNPFPKGPVQDIIEPHEAINESMRKLVRQAADQKDITVCQMTNTEDGERIQKSKDREVVPLNNPKDVSTISMNGINEGQMLFFREMFDRTSMMAGNLITMGGLAPQAGTLGQEELLAAQSNGQVASMQDTTTAFVQRLLGKPGLCWFWWHDPVKVMKTKYDKINIPGVEAIRQVAPWDSQDPMSLPRLGEMPNLKVDPYSMRHQTPQQKASALIDVLTKVWAPFAQIFQQAGVIPDANELMRLLAKYYDNPDMQMVFTISEPPTEEPMGGTGASHAGVMPAETTRNYNRRSLGGESAQAKSATMETMLESGNGKPSKNGQLQL